MGTKRPAQYTFTRRHRPPRTVEDLGIWTHSFVVEDDRSDRAGCAIRTTTTTAITPSRSRYRSTKSVVRVVVFANAATAAAAGGSGYSCYNDGSFCAYTGYADDGGGRERSYILPGHERMLDTAGGPVLCPITQRCLTASRTQRGSRFGVDGRGLRRTQRHGHGKLCVIGAAATTTTVTCIRGSLATTTTASIRRRRSLSTTTTVMLALGMTIRNHHHHPQQ
jgi:hypothetical protein